MGAITMMASALSDLKHPTAWLSDWAGGRPTASGEPVTPATALGLPAVWACVRNLAEDIAKLPLILYRRVSDDRRERAADERLYDLLHTSPNPEMTAITFRQAVTACALLFGTGYAEIARDGLNQPQRLDPIYPSRLRARRSAGGELSYELRDERGVLERRLQPVDVLALPGFSFRGVVGEMVLDVARESLGLCLAADRFAASFFGNGANASGVLIHPGHPDKETRARIREGLAAQHEGSAGKAHRVLLLWDGMKWEHTSADPSEAQSVEARQFGVEEVARLFRMPPHKIGHLLRATGWSTLEQTNLDYLTDTLLPWMIRWEQEVQRRLIGLDYGGPRRPGGALYVEHLVDALLRTDAKARAEISEIRLRSGQIHVDEARRLENEPPAADGYGRVRFMAANMAPVERLATGQTGPAPRTREGDYAAASAEAPSLTPREHTRGETPSGPGADGEVLARLEAILADAIGRCLNKEARAAARAAARCDGDLPAFRAWLTRFYAADGDGHEAAIAEAVRPGLAAYLQVAAGCGRPIDSGLVARTAAEYARRHAERSGRELLAAAGGDATAEAMVLLHQQWTTEAADRAAAELAAAAREAVRPAEETDDGQDASERLHPR